MSAMLGFPLVNEVPTAILKLVGGSLASLLFAWVWVGHFTYLIFTFLIVESNS